MDEKEKSRRYEQLYTDIWLFSLDMHKRNTRRIKIGIAILLLLPVILGLIRWLTDSSKIAFLLIWVLGLFAVGAYLIAIEYLDHQIWKTLKEMTDKEANFDDLIVDRRWISHKIKKAVTNLGLSTTVAGITDLEQQDKSDADAQISESSDTVTNDSYDTDTVLNESSDIYISSNDSSYTDTSLNESPDIYISSNDSSDTDTSLNESPDYDIASNASSDTDDVSSELSGNDITSNGSYDIDNTTNVTRTNDDDNKIEGGAEK